MSEPRHIWLQWYGMDRTDPDYTPEEGGAGDVTYCLDRIYDTDLKYVRCDGPEFEALIERARAALVHGLHKDCENALTDLLAWLEGTP